MDNSVLTFREYNIGGNALRAYYDADGKLVFVLDNTVDNRKPNALLVINPVGGRKWDDILANDYGVDLETVRPKKNNKYQKLDIEYSGLSEYDDLIRAYENGADLSNALVALTHFREDSVRRAAAEPLPVHAKLSMNYRSNCVLCGHSYHSKKRKLGASRQNNLRRKFYGQMHKSMRQMKNCVVRKNVYPMHNGV